MNARTKKVIIGLVILVVALGAVAFYFYYKSAKGTSNSTLANQAEAKALAEKVGKLIVLPTDEIPTIATVSDPNALKDQAFFQEAKKGDKVLIYTNAKKAILYDPVLNKIITVAPLNIGDQKSGALTSPTPTPAPTSPSTSTGGN